MKKTFPCEGCGKQIPDRKDRTTRYCNDCNQKNRCPDCGQRLGLGEHVCANVDLKGERHCSDCGKILSNEGYERWKNRCPKCEKARWNARNRQKKKQLKESFGDACQRCGYNRCKAALHFHHKDASTKVDWNKKKGITGSTRLKTDLRQVAEHPEHFELLCANCHFEVHHS